MSHARCFAAALLLAGMFCSAALAVETGEELPDCAPLRIEFDRAGANRHADKVLLVDFWATWCPPCRLAMPLLDDLRRTHGADGLEVIAINVDEDADAAARYLAQRPVSYPVIYDPEGNCPHDFGLAVMPTTYLVDRQRRIRWIHAGFRRGDEAALRAAVQAALAR